MKVNNVLKPSKLIEGVVPLTTKWVYTVKTDGSVIFWSILQDLLRVDTCMCCVLTVVKHSAL